MRVAVGYQRPGVARPYLEQEAASAVERPSVVVPASGLVVRPLACQWLLEPPGLYRLLEEERLPHLEEEDRPFHEVARPFLYLAAYLAACLAAGHHCVALPPSCQGFVRYQFRSFYSPAAALTAFQTEPPP